MDPLSVLGLVSNIIQLVDAAANAYVLCSEIHKLGSSIEDSQISYTSGQLQQCYVSLNESLKRNEKADSKVLRSGVNLTDLASFCCETAKELQTELGSLYKKPGGGLRDTFHKAVLKKRKARHIEQLKQRLDECQKVLDTKILIDLRQGLGTLETQEGEQHAKIEQRLSQLSVDLANCHTPVSKQFKLEIDKVIRAHEEQHNLTRQEIEKTAGHITAALRDLDISQERYRNHEFQIQESSQIFDNFLKSLIFDSMNLRKNEVVANCPKTFEWIYDEDRKHPWDSFAAWLKDANSVYWINGKAGSGKSTLMKFIANDSRTKSLLAHWSPNTDVMIVTYYFWLSGSKMQRDIKGFLCSVTYQMIVKDKKLFAKGVADKNELLMKRSVNDWSCSELSQLLKLLVENLTRPMCILIDGLDELGVEDDVDDLLGLVQDFSTKQKVKLCISSRPEVHIMKQLSQCRKLRLQDLTDQDIEITIRGELDRLRSRFATALEIAQVEEIINTIKWKADGVFLWVRYVLRSVTNGIRKEDDFNELLNRLRELPSGMKQLYSQMWRRLNDDEQRYRNEAAEYFSYVLAVGNYYRFSIFELWVALDPQLQHAYLEEFVLQSPNDITRGCERLKTRILTRCAGLLELIEEETDDDEEEETDEETPTPLKINNFRGKVQQNRRIREYHNLKVVFLHRTARDFLLESEDGRTLLGESSTSVEPFLESILKAQIATLIQGLETLSFRSVSNVMERARDTGLKKNKDLLCILKSVCQLLSVPGRPTKDTQCREFWLNNHLIPNVCADFEGVAAHFECAEYVLHYVANMDPPASPTYLGYIFLCGAVSSFKRSRTYDPTNTFMLTWLVSHGADLFAKYKCEGKILMPVTECLLGIMAATPKQDYDMGMQSLEFIHQLLPILIESEEECLVGLNFERESIRLCSILDHVMIFSIYVYMSVPFLSFMTMRIIEQKSGCKAQWSQHTSSDEQNTRVIFICKKGSFEGWHISDKDSRQLGGVLDKTLIEWLSSPQLLSRPDLTQYFDYQVEEVRLRSPECWAREFLQREGCRED